ncbi:MAG TPA: hypothetical protein VIF08_00885 [Candidatus Limnocylindrales bacterium]
MAVKFRRRFLGALFAGVLVITACSGGPFLVSRADGEPAPQLLRPVTNQPAPLASCGGHPFAPEALDAPPTDQVGPEFDALRAVFAAHAGEFEGTPEQEPWKLVDKQDDQLLFVADSGSGLLYVFLRRQGDIWKFANMGDCQLHAALGDGAGAARWWLDPRRPFPTADSVVLEILVLEQACASGNYATGRILPPAVVYEAEAITVTIGVRGVGGTCQGNPDTPAVLTLNEPLGDRELLDGFFIPPAPALPPAP